LNSIFIEFIIFRKNSNEFSGIFYNRFTIVPAAPTATVGILRKLVVEWLKKVQNKVYSEIDVKINVNNSSPVAATVICVAPKKKYKPNSVVHDTVSDDDLSQEYLQNVEIVINEEFFQNDEEFLQNDEEFFRNVEEFLQNDEEKENSGNFNNPWAVKPTRGF
jgi:hypothetical protein